MAGVGIQTSFKTSADTLINVQGDDPNEWDMHLAHVLENAEKIRAAELALKGADQTPPPGGGIAGLQNALGAREINEQEFPQAPPPAGGYQQTTCLRCMQAPVCKNCGRPCNLVPKQVKEWHVHDCPSGDRSHKGAWCNLPK